MDSEATVEYLDETHEVLTRLTLNMQELKEGRGQIHSIVDEIYRDIHTVKGSSQLFGFNNVGNISHVLEAILGPIREGRTEFISADLIDMFYQAIGHCEELLKKIQESGADEDSSAAEFTARLVERIEREILSSPDERPRKASLIEINYSPDTEKNQDLAQQLNESRTVKTEPVAIKPDGLDKQVAEPEPIADEPELTKELQIKEVPDLGEPMPPAAAEQEPLPVEEKEKSMSSVRVNIGILDKLMNLVGELVLVRNQVVQYGGKNDSLELANLSQDLDVVTSDLQEEVMKTRMQPIGIVLNKFQRVVHDIARDLGKKIELELEGVSTEVDRTLLDAIKDPLTHIVRNSCDHGVEGTEDRVAAGKSETGKVKIHAFHEGGQVVIQITDDGRGIDRKRVVDKAVEKDIVSAVQAKSMSDKEVYSLIFAPGFSTAAKVSAVSGRGVGMDVVKTNIERVGGAVEISSIPGRQTQISLRIPLTLAIIPALTVVCAGRVFAIPQVKLEELVRISQQDDSEVGIEYLQGKPIYRLRGQLLPLVGLRDVLGEEEKTDLLEKDVINVVVLRSESTVFGLVVDQILDNSDIVVKPISPFLKKIPVYSGSTILGDGNVALILDVVGLAKYSGIGEGAQTDSVLEEREQSDASRMVDTTEYLLIQLAGQKNYAVPLCLVNRLEEFEAKSIEYSGDIPVVQYRNSLLPIISLENSLNLKSEGGRAGDILSVVVVLYQGEIYGLHVEKILDVVETGEQASDLIQDRDGVLGNVVIEGSLITIIDALKIVAQEIQRLNVNRSLEQKTEVKQRKLEKKTILLVEDTMFFRRQIRRYLDEEGFDVIEAEDGQLGYETLVLNRDKVDLVLSDIEMPNMTGLELAKKVRADSRFQNLPMIAITTKFSQRDVEIGLEAGFNKYLGKLERGELVHEIGAIINEGQKNVG